MGIYNEILWVSIIMSLLPSCSVEGNQSPAPSGYDHRMTAITWVFNDSTSLLTDNRLQNFDGLYYQGDSKSLLVKLRNKRSILLSDGTYIDAEHALSLPAGNFEGGNS